MSNISNESSGLPSSMVYLTSRSTKKFKLQSGNYSDIIYLFDGSLYLPTGFIFMVSLVDFICPITWHVIASYNENNTLYYLIDGDTYTYIILDGNYSANDIVTLFNASEIYTEHNIYTTYDVITNKFVFTNLNNINFAFLSTSTTFELLGFSDDNHISTDYVLFSDDQVDLAGTREIYITTNLECLSLDCRAGALSNNVIAKIPVTGNSGDIITYSNISNFRTTVRDKKINKMQIRLEDDRGRLINLTHNYSVSFDFHVVPDKFLIYQNALT